MDKAAIEKAEAFRQHIGKVIRKNRRKCDLKQYNLAEMLGVEETTISRYENAKTEIRASTMAYISQICGFELKEYIPGEGMLVSQEFQKIVSMSDISPHSGYAETVRKFSPGSLQDIQFMDYTPDGRMLFSATTDEGIQEKARPKLDILTDLPKTVPLPLCEDDNEAFERYMSMRENSDRLHILFHGYRLLMLFQDMDVPCRTISSMARQILRRLIKTSSGKIDQEVYGYYWSSSSISHRTKLITVPPKPRRSRIALRRAGRGWTS